MSEIGIISSDLDGAELRREKRKNPRHVCCNGRDDAGAIQEALNHTDRTFFAGLGEAWERIFRRQGN